MAAREEEARTEVRDGEARTAAETFRPAIRYGISEVERRIGLERSTISRHCRAGMFPKPLYLGTRRFWTEEQIADWEAQQFARQPEAAHRVRQLMEPAQAARDLTCRVRVGQ